MGTLAGSYLNHLPTLAVWVLYINILTITTRWEIGFNSGHVFLANERLTITFSSTAPIN